MVLIIVLCVCVCVCVVCVCVVCVPPPPNQTNTTTPTTPETLSWDNHILHPPPHHTTPHQPRHNTNTTQQEFGKLSWDGKRDQWAGYRAEDHERVIER